MSNHTDDHLLGSADEKEISLSQAILAPLDAIFKAQIHSARSFLNLLMQVGYPHIPVGEDGMPDFKELTDEKKQPYKMKLNFSSNDPQNPDVIKNHQVEIPTLALVPLSSLAVESGEFKFGMRIKSIYKHEQLQKSEEKEFGKKEPYKSPWFLVSDPISLRGNITPSSKTSSNVSTESTIEITIKVAKSPIPSALDKLLVSLTQSMITKEINTDINQ
ncbi:MAG: hypothetical protein POELPBGB_01332 [Bacteroidia bacterium]|nr:hypothetical protein [Bacteroidia bacterium]